MLMGIKDKTFVIVLASIGLMFLGCTMTVSGIVVPDPEFLTFGDFENVEVDDHGFPDGHRLLGGEGREGTVSIDDTVARSGTQSLLIEGVGASNQGFGLNTSFTRDLEAGETYKATLWYRAPELLEDTSSGEKIRFQLNLAGAAVGAGWSWDDVSIMPLSPGTDYSLLIDHSSHRQLSALPLPGIAQQDPNDPSDWSELSMIFTLPEDFDGISIIINIYNKTDHPLWIDDLSFQRIKLDP